MAIITISRGTFAGGALLADRLARALDYRIVSREQLYHQVSEKYAVNLAHIAAAMDSTPSLLDPSARTARRLLSTVQATLCELVADDAVVYHGQAGHLLLPGISHVLRIRLIAPRSLRIAMAVQRESVSAVEAGRKIDQVDAERARWTQFFYGVTWGDPALYDLTLNIDGMPLDDAVATVAYLAKRPGFQPTEESVRRLRDLTLAAQVKAKLLTEPATSHLDLEVQTEAGRVRLGSPMSDEDLERVRDVVGSLPGLVALEAVRHIVTDRDREAITAR